MKSWKAFATAALIGAALAGQQQSVQAQVVLGAKLGWTSSTLDVDDEDAETDRLSSFGGGGFLRFGFGGLSLQPELLALTKGAETTLEGFGTAKLKLDYVEVPVFLRFGLGQSSSFTPYLMAGPSFSFEIGCEAEAEGGGGSISADCDEDNDFDRAKLDIGLAAALGFEFAAGPGNILVEGRYTHGFTDISKDETSKVRNRMFGIFAGYAVPLGSR